MMDKIFEFLDLKRWLLATALILIMALSIYITTNYVQKFVDSKDRFKIEDYMGNYSLLLDLQIPQKDRKVTFETFKYFNLIPFEENKKISIVSPQKKEETPPVYKISLIYIRDGKKYVIINNKILTEGSKISDKEYIVKIEEDGVLLNGYWGARWIKL